MKSLLCAKSEMLRLNLKSWSMQFARIPQPRWAREWSGKWRRKSGRWPTSRVKNNSFPPPSPHTWVKLACGSKNKLTKLRRCDNSRQSGKIWVPSLAQWTPPLPSDFDFKIFSLPVPCPNGLESRVTIPVSFQRHCFPFLTLFLCWRWCLQRMSENVRGDVRDVKSSKGVSLALRNHKSNK